MLSFFSEFWDFLRQRKKLWMIPLLTALLLMAALLALAGSKSVLAPFIYTLF